MNSQPPAADWSTGKRSGLVSIGSHSLFLKVSGPTRKPGDPIVIVECGHSDFSNTWAAVQRSISHFARICTYDRAGYGHSEPSDLPRTAQNIAQELLSLLLPRSGHQFLALLDVQNMVAGMVLVDTVQEKSDIEGPWPMPQLIAVGGDLDRYKVIGLEDTHKLTREEWEEAKSLETKENYGITGERESEEMSSSEGALASKAQMKTQVLGNKRLSVIKGNSARDIRMIYDAGVQAGNGTSEDRRILKVFVEGLDDLETRLQSEQLDLSNDSRMIYATEGGHNVHVRQPEIIAQEVRWVLKI